MKKLIFPEFDNFFFLKDGYTNIVSDYSYGILNHKCEFLEAYCSMVSSNAKSKNRKFPFTREGYEDAKTWIVVQKLFFE